jgi:hypothetical protein
MKVDVPPKPAVDENTTSLDEGQSRVGQTIADFSREFDDDEHLVSNLSQARRLQAEAGHSDKAFIHLMFQARSRTRQAAGVLNRMSYFFACLRSLMEIDVANSATEPVAAQANAD